MTFVLTTANASRRLIILSLLAFICSSPDLADKQLGSFNAGLKAYDAGNYGTVMKYWLPLAKNGHLDAQLGIADIYHRGLLGKSQPDKAYYWHRQAATQGSPLAFIALGERAELFKAGQDGHAQAYYWYGLAAGLNNNYAKNEVQRLGAKLPGEKKKLQDERIRKYFAE